MAEEGNTSWHALSRELTVDEGQVAFYERVIELQLELARRLERHGVDGDAVMRILEVDSERLQTIVRQGEEIDLGALGDALAERAGGLAPE